MKRPGARRRDIERQLAMARGELDRLRYRLRHAETELRYCRPATAEDWRALYDEKGWPEHLTCGRCGAPHDEVDHEGLGR